MEGHTLTQRITAAISRARTSAVIWFWAFNGVRLVSGLLLLPLLATKLGKQEFGMYYVFVSITALVPFLDLGFAGTVARFVSYASAGVTELKAQGLPPAPNGNGPCYPLLWGLLYTTRSLYRYVSLAGLLIMGLWGTSIVHATAGKTASPNVTWAAWGLTLIAGTLELYSMWWSSYLYALNKVQETGRINFIAYALRVSLACVLLIAGMGLLSVPAASLVGSLLGRFWSRRMVLEHLGPTPSNFERLTTSSLLHLLWPNSWRLALQVLSTYLRGNATIQICVAFFGLAVTGEYGLSLQVMNIVVGMASVWSMVKWPQVGQLRSANDFVGLRKVLWPRIWLQLITFAMLGGLAIFAGPALLELIHTDKQLLPSSWLLVMALTAVLDMNCVFWGTFLASENRIPTLWSTVITNVSTLVLCLALSKFTSLGVFSLVIAPLVSGVVFLYWYWPKAGAQGLGTNWVRFMFSRPRTAG